VPKAPDVLSKRLDSLSLILFNPGIEVSNKLAESLPILILTLPVRILPNLAGPAPKR